MVTHLPVEPPGSRARARIVPVVPKTGTGDRYALALGELWSGLARTLTRLDVAAAEPEALDDDAVSSLRRLQYALHLASEHAYGLEPPPAAASAHAELADALAAARDATADVAEAASIWGADGVNPLLHEWRGALFRVRLARMRLAAPQPPTPRAEPGSDEGVGRPLLAFLLALLGALAFAAGATLGLWPLWVAGLVAVCGSVLVYRP
jgi:hypothetical protein